MRGDQRYLLAGCEAGGNLHREVLVRRLPWGVLGMRLRVVWAVVENGTEEVGGVIVGAGAARVAWRHREDESNLF